MRHAVSLAIWVVASLGAARAGAEVFGNDSVIALTKAGLGADVLLSKIASLPCSYDVSTEGIMRLKGAGVENPVIAAMVDRCTGASKAQGAVVAGSDPSVKRPPGLYVDLGNGSTRDLVRVRPTNANGGRITGNGSLLFPLRTLLSVPRAMAQIVAGSAQPTFYFYFETDDAKVGDFGTSRTISAQSPAEFTLVRLKPKDGQREITVGKQKMFGGTIGLDPKDSIHFSTEEIGDGIFAVRPGAPLAAGEYGFVLRSGSEAYQVFDFQVRG